jgi:hypothetical protein
MPNFAAATNTLEALLRVRWLERKVYDQVFQNTPLLSIFYERNEVRPNAPAFEVSVNVGDPTTAYWIEGYDTFSYAPFDSVRSAVFKARTIVMPSQFSDDELSASEDPDSLQQIIDYHLDVIQASLAERLEAALVQGDPAAKQFPGLTRAVDDGTISATYGDLSRAVYPAWRAIVDAAAGTPSFTKLLTPLVAAVRGNEAPKLGMTTRPLWIEILNSIMPNERIATPQQDYSTGPARTFVFAGLPVYHNVFLPNQHFFWLNPESFGMITVKGRDGVFRGYRIADNQEVWYGRLVWKGLFYCKRPNTNAKFTALT